jgi:excisionase family DNA binding protein
MRADGSHPPPEATPNGARAGCPTGSYDPDPGSGDVASMGVEPAAEVVDVAVVAQLLRVGRNTVYALVARNEIPHRRLGKQIRFHRAAVMRWLASWSSQGAKEGH